ncbi:ABC transporter permease [Zhaonella formicivorans]|uniref:ABC transporter permease n=1 Tax=Zhaonella formicivorans TaxID=2528593 RepID=UPI001D12FA58|nr:FtsX-like permease family protein [Zhaonella formicivorans]
MRLTDVALANLKVRKVKMAFLLLGIVLSLGTIVSLYTLISSLQVQLQEQMEKMGVRFVITPAVETVSYAYNGIVVGDTTVSKQQTLPFETVEQIKDMDLPSLDVISPKLVIANQMNGTNVLLSGIQLEQELALKSWWEVKEGRLPEKKDELLLGSKSAMQTGLKTGDKLNFFGQDFLVSGILKESGQAEDRLVFVDLHTLQNLSGEQDFSFAELRFKVSQSGKEAEYLIDAYSQTLKKGLPGVRVARIKDETLARQAVIQQFARFASLVAIVVFIIGWLIMAITMMSSVNERSREIGILRAIGYRKSHVMQIIILEAGIISSLGGAAGYLTGFGIGAAILPFLSDTGSRVAWSPMVPLVVLAVSVLVGLTAAIYPAYRATRLDPVEALRQV